LKKKISRIAAVVPICGAENHVFVRYTMHHFDHLQVIDNQGMNSEQVAA